MAGLSAPLRRLSAELRRLREESGRTQADVGAAIGRTQGSLANWETGKTRISARDLTSLLAELDAPADVRQALEDLRKAARESRQWAIYDLPEWLRPFVNFEQEADKITDFQPVLIPGLLQTADYARAIHTTGEQVHGSGNAERWLAARMQRQQRLYEDNPLKLHAVIAEAAFHCMLGGQHVMTEQIRHLIAITELDNITLQIVPFSSPTQSTVATNFLTLHFSDPATNPPLAYSDGPLGGYFISNPNDVTRLTNAFELLRSVALSKVKSRELLAKILREYQLKSVFRA